MGCVEGDVWNLNCTEFGLCRGRGLENKSIESGLCTGRGLESESN